MRVLGALAAADVWAIHLELLTTRAFFGRCCFGSGHGFGQRRPLMPCSRMAAPGFAQQIKVVGHPAKTRQRT